MGMQEKNNKDSSSTDGLNKDEIQEILKELSDADSAKLHSYTQQKNFTKGLVDIALLTANANQLRHVIQFENETMRTLNIVFISLSILLQVVAGILLIICHQVCIKTEKDLSKCQKITTAISSIMLVIIVLNILVVSLGGPE